MPVAVAVPGSAVPVANDKDKVTLDVLGMVRDEQGCPRRPHPRDADSCRRARRRRSPAKQVLYQTGVTLPPGRFSVKVVVRENTTGQMGIVRGADRRARAEDGADEGQLGRAQHAAADRRHKGKTDNPLVRDGVQLVPNLTHIVGTRSEAVFLLRGLRPAGRRTVGARSSAPASRSTAAR